MSRRGIYGGLAARVGLMTLLVAAIAIGVIAVGVLVVAQSTFSRLMTQAGSSAAFAHDMFDHGVAIIFVIAAIIAAVVSLILAVLLARRLARPLDDVASAARLIAEGQYQARVPRSGFEEVASLADSFNQMAVTLEEQERLRSEFIINAAHELRTPLTNLQGYLEALRDGVLPPSQELFHSLHEETQRLVRLSRSLDALADHDVSRAADRIDVDLCQAIRSAAELARPSFDAKGIRMDLRLPAGLRARANPDQLAQVLANLLQNASRYTPDGGLVTVAASSRRDDALVTVANTGEGIPKHDLPHVFERFYRVEKSRDPARGGAGIGLAIVKQLVEAGGGRVGAESDSGATRFWFSVPT